MKTPNSFRKSGFTLLETVIAIGVLAVLLTGFMIVFAPAAAGIKKSINVQEADRLASTLEQELVTLRSGQAPTGATTGFTKAFEWIRDNTSADNALLIYKYRGSLTSLRKDGTPDPVKSVSDKLPGTDYVVRTMLRRKSDTEFTEDLDGLEGPVFLVKCTQLVFNNGELKTGTSGKIVDPKNTGTVATDADAYPEAVIAFSAEFYQLPANSPAYFNSRFATTFSSIQNPVFTRNLAVRR